ncbi:TPA: hypothetical protein ACXE54_000510 [Klebsiella michiganensis]|uniref:hypothetical protein n=2 Tax=Klebsiella/Raoultella group TaxID=2890311 RepID=UPI0004511B61|nr:hypothetical protein [Klebsiella oxytoca]ELS4548899.1 hypothetical protein [Klebsiella michiganensis]EUC90806.1 hypothetical protein HMPREF1569_1093 [Klebsiella oxytoca OK-1]QRS60043.1 hypothetical protein I6K62_25010 [Klebsiella oxytoca]UNI53046.1 hypothetical protein MN553_21145 [Klebsiella oxytoca]HBM3247724.1 hypothetical protein [Klebsiella oxytoca]
MKKLKLVNRRNRTRKTHEVVASVLKPPASLKPIDEAKKDAFYFFIARSTDKEFENALDILLKDEGVLGCLNQSKMPYNQIVNKEIISQDDIEPIRLMHLYKSILLRQSNELIKVNRLRDGLDDLLIKGLYSEVNERLDEINNIIGLSIWEMNYRIAVLTASNNFKTIDTLVESWKTEKISSTLYEVVRVSGWKSHSPESSTAIETMVRRSNKEYIEGGALDIAAFYSAMCLQYPLYDDVDLSYCFYWLQKLPLVDLYDTLQKIAIYGIVKNKNDGSINNEFINLFEQLNSKLQEKSLEKILIALRGESLKHYSANVDREVLEYTEGNYNLLLDRLESKPNEIKNLITKVNIIAKAYIYSSRKPQNLPSLLFTIVTNLISIYSLKNSNQAIAQLINLVIIYSSLELSDQILLSILKSAPFFLDEHKKTKLIEKTKFINTPLTPLACNLESPPSLYSDYLNAIGTPNINRLLKLKTIEAIKNKRDNAFDLICEYEIKALIPKDSIELKVEFYLKNNCLSELIEFSANELIKNPNANICLPLEDIVGFINEKKIYSLDAVICAYYYNLYSNEDQSEFLNEFFEEYILTLGIDRPSELLDNNLNDKEVIFLHHIAKIDVMDYLGCFDDANDLKIERIKILNKLVSLGYLKQSDIDIECKYIVDGMLIDSEAARFNNSKIFVDTKHIFEKRKQEVEGLISKYNGDDQIEIQDTNVQYQIEDVTILKGNKEIIILRLINTLLIEYFNNKEVGLDINLGTEIRHGFFGNLICSSPQNRRLITELDEVGNYKSNEYWLSYYKIISEHILNDVDSLLVKFSADFNRLIDVAEQWMKTSLNGDEKERIFTFDISLEDFSSIKELMDEGCTSEEVSTLIFKIFNVKLSECLYLMKRQLNMTFASLIDDLYSELIDSITVAKRGTSMSTLLDEIRLSNTEVKENIRTVCEWFSLKKTTLLETIELEKLIHLAIKCFQQINNCEINLSINKNSKNYIPGSHIYALVLCLINCLNNSYKYSDKDLNVAIDIYGKDNGMFKISISNKLTDQARESLSTDRFKQILSKLVNMNDSELLVNNGGSGLYKSLHALRNVSTEYDLIPNFNEKTFTVEIRHGY